LLPVENVHAVWSRLKPHLASKADGLREKITRETKRITNLVRIVSAPRLGQRLGLMELDCSLACGSHGRNRILHHVLGAHPSAGELALGRGSRRVRHFGNPFLDVASA